MMSASHQSQFTQSLLLFVRLTIHRMQFSCYLTFSAQSQTQSGRRYTPHLTRFYTCLAPPLMMSLIREALESLNVRCKRPEDSTSGAGSLRLRIGGYDKRKVMFKGWIELEPFTYRGMEGSFCVMQRDIVRVSANSWLSRVSYLRPGKSHIVETAVESPDIGSCRRPAGPEKVKDEQRKDQTTSSVIALRWFV
jgi:hypothetical protein